MARRSKPKDIDLQNNKECDKLKDRMRVVFMRLTVTNEVKDPEMIKKHGNTFTYTEEYIKNYRYDLAFLSSSGYDEIRITSWSEAQTNVRRAVIESAAKTYILMTPMKRKKRSYFVTCRTENVELITT